MKEGKINKNRLVSGQVDCLLYGGFGTDGSNNNEKGALELAQWGVSLPMAFQKPSNGCLLEIQIFHSCFLGSALWLFGCKRPHA